MPTFWIHPVIANRDDQGDYRVGQKMAQFLYTSTTSSNINRFLKNFYYQN